MKIVVTSPSFSKNEILKNELLRSFPRAIFNEEGNKFSGKKLIKFVKGADGIIVGLERLDQSVLGECDALKIISKYGVGLDNIDLEYCKERGISIGWTPGVNRISVAEMTIAFMLALSRNLFLTSNQLKTGLWNKDGGSDLRGKTVGIIGIGNIGKEIIRLLKVFGNRILVNDIVEQREYYSVNKVIETTKEEIYRQSDIVTLHVPFNSDTLHLINRDVFREMKNCAYLINTSRGKVVEQNSLKWALMNGIIAGAAIDVYEEEPPEDKELLSLPNLICTPHIGGNALESVLAMGRSAIRHLQGFFEV
ncbi:MAG: phosphoglycerate dehydrogenase [Deltaproteobacteria bacterium]